jgi:AbrB family looped-hinge helix DNA binding protein
MSVALSKLTSQGQVSVPAAIRRKLGVGPGSTLEWDQQGNQIIVRRSGRFSSEDIHRALFPKGAPASHTLDELKEGIRQRTRAKYAGH